ncbi:MAG: hypothetical protein OHK0032_14420 [Thermodesulfovibrionales bacterium]
MKSDIAKLTPSRMKIDKYTDIICKGFCKFYKEGKEELRCETYNLLSRRFSPEELKSMIQDVAAKPDRSFDREIRTLICEKCDFVVDGCDFRDGLDSPPCGGYAIIEGLIKKGVIKFSM